MARIFVDHHKLKFMPLRMSSELEANRWSVISERGCEASGLTHEDARRLVHRLGSEGHHGLWIITDEAASHLAAREAAEPVNS